jgi:hypothetical protein
MPYQPDDFWEIDPEYAEVYASMVATGRAVAAELSVAIVAIARNSQPHLANTLELLDQVAGGFKSARGYIFENGSLDDTAGELDDFAASHPWLVVEHGTEAGVDSRGFERERTERLAACRNRCQDWVRDNAADTTYTIVVDTDPARGFSVDGVFNSIGWIGHLSGTTASRPVGGMASYSVFRHEQGGRGPHKWLAYDAWAARQNWWRDMRHEAGFEWFHFLLPPAGSPPIPFNSVFGGLAVYQTRAFLDGRYAGDDCEHVPLHRSMRAAGGWQMYLNPGSRYVAQ